MAAQDCKIEASHHQPFLTENNIVKIEAFLDKKLDHVRPLKPDTFDKTTIYVQVGLRTIVLHCQPEQESHEGSLTGEADVG